jgi:cytochrome c-type biogenesis protein CcmH/NrfG
MKRSFLILMVFLSASILYSQNKNDENAIIREMENALEKEPANKEILLKLGILYHNIGLKGDKGAVDRGEEILKRLIKIDPNNADAHCFLIFSIV